MNSVESSSVWREISETNLIFSIRGELTVSGDIRGELTVAGVIRG